ncbi:MAG TPA: hypothetical protein VJ385_00655 [Fibrobacteria bacterium]|nr:hypothetical protein [Fibrobacteria bacterium]
MHFTLTQRYLPAVLWAVSVSAAESAGVDGTGIRPLQQDLIHAIYLDGDFEQASQLLETALKEKRVRTHDDSIFTFKHLGVMNAAREETREIGKYYMVQLLNLEPTAKILDMYASDMIYMIFKNIKEEFDENRLRMERAAHMMSEMKKSAPLETAPAALDRPSAPDSAMLAATAKVGKRSKRKTLFWIGGVGATLVGVGLGMYLLDTRETPSPIAYHVD